MPSTHDPDHARGASLVLPGEAEETGHSAPARKESTVKAARSPTRFWLGLVALLSGLAVLAAGLIFFSAWPGALAGEVFGAGLALLAICALLLSGAWRPARSHPITPAAPVDLPIDLLATPAPPPTSTEPAVQPPTLEPTAEPIAAAPIAPPDESVPEAAPEDAAPADAPADPDASAEAAPVTEPEPSPTPEAPPAASKSAPGAPRSPARATTNGTQPRMPALTGLPQGAPLPTDRTLINAEVNELGELLGDIAEQSVLVMLTKGQRGTQRRERMAGKIEVFRQEMARDPDYAPIANFLEAIVGLLRAGQPIPATQPLVEPFYGLYEYVLTLIRRKSGTQHD